MPVERRGQVTRIGIVRVNGKPEELDGRDGGQQPAMGGTSRVNREVYARFCERLGVKFPRPTRRVGRTRKVSPSLLLYWPDLLRRIWRSAISRRPPPRRTRVVGSGVVASMKRCSAVLPLPGVPGCQMSTLFKNELEIWPLV